LSEVPSLSVPLASATLPIRGAKAAPREPLPTRRASDRYVVAPHYAALCERILARLHEGRPASLWIIPTTLDTDASSVVAELSLSLAQIANDTVLALDCDGPRNATDDGAEVGLGVADVLGDRVDWQKAVNPTRDRRVQLIGTGRRATLGALTSANALRLAPLIAEMKTRYRFIVIHGGATVVASSAGASPGKSPKGAVRAARQKTGVLALTLARAADLTYLVLPLYQTSNRQARAAKRRLEQLGGVVHGTILTGGAPIEHQASDLRAAT
jgi:hypothetical protein